MKKEIFPYFRKRFAKILNKEPWINNGSARIVYEDVLQVISADFVSNSNVKKAYDILKPTLETYRFKRVDFLWFKDAIAHESFSILSPPDMADFKQNEQKNYLAMIFSLEPY